MFTFKAKQHKLDLIVMSLRLGSRDFYSNQKLKQTLFAIGSTLSGCVIIRRQSYKRNSVLKEDQISLELLDSLFKTKFI